jgi:lipid A 4'-phosphatase
VIKKFFQLAQWTFPLWVLLFVAFPQLDLSVSQYFWHADSGFWGGHIAWIYVTHKYIGVVFGIVFFGIFSAWLVSWFNRSPELLRKHRKSMSYILLVVMLGPGLLVNLVFKDQWGRARPVHLEQFGGERAFTPAWIPSDQCGHNCSFVCGDASLGFVIIAGIFISRRPRLWLVSSLFLGGVLGYMRIAQGGHFISDVIFSGYAVVFSTWLIARLLRPGRLSNLSGQAGNEFVLKAG